MVGTGQINLAVLTQSQLAGSAPVNVEIYDKRVGQPLPFRKK